MTAQQLELMRNGEVERTGPMPLDRFLQFELAIQLANIHHALWNLYETAESWLCDQEVAREPAAAPPANAWPPRCGVPLDNDRTCDAPAEHIDLVGRLFICDRHHGEHASVRRVLTGGIPQ